MTDWLDDVKRDSDEQQLSELEKRANAKAVIEAVWGEITSRFKETQAFLQRECKPDLGWNVVDSRFREDHFQIRRSVELLVVNRKVKRPDWSTLVKVTVSADASRAFKPVLEVSGSEERISLSDYSDEWLKFYLGRSVRMALKW